MKSISAIKGPCNTQFGKHSKICVIRSAEAPPYTEEANSVDQFLRKAGYANVDMVEVNRLNYGRLLQEVLTQKYELIFNVCDGTVMDVKAGFDCDIPFVSPSIKGYDPTREEMKQACIATNIPTPKHTFVYDLEIDLPKLKWMEFPMIVKHFNSAGSWDMTIDSKVTNQEQLETQVKRMVDRNHGALVEEFIEGREFTCLLVDNADDLNEPYIYQPVEFIFLNKGDTFKYRTLKFDNCSDMKSVPVDDPDISKRIKEMCRNFYHTLKTESYARYDLRMDSKGKLYMLEINPIPQMFYPCDYGTADLVVMNTPGGYAEFLKCVMQAAVKRHQLRQRSWNIVHELPIGSCCKALKPFTENQAIHSLMGKDIKLESIDNMSFAAKASSQISENRFYLPIPGDFIIVSQNELDNYKFLQPSEDPNCWLDALCITARRNITAGETLTFDYSTLYGDRWQNLIDCAQANFDWKTLAQKYEGHVSTFVEKMVLQQL